MDTLGLHEVDRSKLALVGGKAANLGELTQLDGVHVPDGFCVTTDAYANAMTNNDEFAALLDQLSETDDHDRIRDISARLRKVIEGTAVPAGEIGGQLDRLGADGTYAVRSSATAEDLPTASFAGQHDTYLNIVGRASILRHISKCWASLFTERAVAYRIRHGFGHREVRLAVIVQRMVVSHAAGVMFTADPITSDRKTTAIEAAAGLGDGLVSGHVNADRYHVRDGRVVRAAGRSTLTDQQVLRLQRIGATIADHFGAPQDIEWCLTGDTFAIVQSRPITTLFPMASGPKDGKTRVYMSFSHQQVMTDAMTPLGSSFFRLGFKETLIESGGRLYVDLSSDLASPVGRRVILAALNQIDPPMVTAVRTLTKRHGFIDGLARDGQRYIGNFSLALPVEAVRIHRANDPAIVRTLTSRYAASVQETRQKIANLSGDALFEFILDDIRQLREVLYSPRSMAVVNVAQYALTWINRHMEKWLGEKGAADTLAQSVTDNVTSEMGLTLLDVADVVRRYPAVIDYLRQADDETFFTDLAGLEGGDVVGQAIQDYLEKYGMRCPGEIDITRPRWHEKPSELASIILNNVRNFAPNARSAIVEKGQRVAAEKERALLDRLERLPGGNRKARKTRKMISRLRNFAGYREYPKYLMTQRYWVIKQAMTKEAETLVRNGVLQNKDDVYFLSFDEFRHAVRTNEVDHDTIAQRKEDHETFAKLTPPRMITSDGEVVSGEYGTVPVGALAGVPASSGTVEGRARVVARIEDADLEDGDILVTTFTDPSWTPVFLSVRGLVTEVGGTMTHGAVVAREYGLPAVVGVDGATRLIQDGQRIRVHGTQGYVEILQGTEGKP